MRKSKLVAPVELQISAGIRDLFDDPPLLMSENGQAYFNVLSAIADDVKPDGVIEWLWLKDIVLQTWEIQRLWAFKRHIIELERNARADKIATAAFREKRSAQNPDFELLDELLLRSKTMDPETKRQLTPKLDTEADFAQAFSDRIDVLEKLDRQIASLERRRDNTLREIELRREILARRPREASAKLIEVKDSKALIAAE